MINNKINYDTDKGRDLVARCILFEILDELQFGQKIYAKIPESVNESDLQDVWKKMNQHCGDLMGVLLGESKIVCSNETHI